MLQIPFPIFQFTPEAKIFNWKVIDDVVMGGVSNGNFKLNEEGFGNFYGNVSLENNGGFSSVHYKFESIKTAGFTKVVLKLKGDGKEYQFRIKDQLSNSYAYIHKFSTTKKWETIEIQLSEMYPAFRGKKLNMENFNSATITQIAFLIANKKNESFQLQLEGIYLK